MISAQSRVLLDRYALASNAMARTSGERQATEAGQSVEFRDFRPYQRGDELRYVDWRGYARSGRLYTRLFQAERTIALHVLLDTSASMRTGAKARYARRVAEILAYAAQKDARSQVHLMDGRHSGPAQGRAGIAETWSFIGEAPELTGPDPTPFAGIADFALGLPPHRGAALVLIVSDLFDPGPLRPALAALRARGLDAGFLQIVAGEDLDPDEGHLEVVDRESGATLDVSPDDVRAYRSSVRQHLERTRAAIVRAGFRHVLLRTEGESDADLERAAFAALIREGVLVRR